MDEEARDLLHKNLELAKENNDMLRAMRRSMRISQIMTFVYWAFIVGTALGAYYFLQPYFDQLVSIYGGAKSGINNVGEVFQNLGP